jgi:hypothetical protein
MPDDAHQQRLNGLEERQRNLLTKLARLQTDHDLETRTEEKLRLGYGIAETLYCNHTRLEKTSWAL